MPGVSCVRPSRTRSLVTCRPLASTGTVASQCTLSICHCSATFIGQTSVVIGGAVMGASVAFWLTRLNPGIDVLVVERDPTFAHASTALSAAGIRQQFTNPVNVQISRFGVDFIKNFQERLGHDVGIPSLGFRENGYLFLATTETARDTLAEGRTP